MEIDFRKRFEESAQKTRIINLENELLREFVKLNKMPRRKNNGPTIN